MFKLSISVSGVLLLSALGGIALGQEATLSLAVASDEMPMVDLPTLMEHVIQPAAYGIWNASGYVIDREGVHDLSPATDDDWEDLVTASATLLESTHAMMMPERVLDDKWPVFVRRLNESAEEALMAAESHDKQGIAKVGDEMDEICTACHKNYGYE